MPPLHVIWITPRFPLGAPDGARHATATLLDQLTRQGEVVDVVSFVGAEETVDLAAGLERFKLRSLSVIRRSASLWMRLPTFWRPFTFRTYTTAAVRAAMAEKLKLLLDASPRCSIVIDGLHPFAALPEGWLAAHPKKTVSVVYRAHNYETALWEQCVVTAKTPWYRLFFKQQSALVRAFEQSVAQGVDGVAPVSAEDGERFHQVAPQTPVSVTPIGMEFAEAAPSPSTARNSLAALFVGRLDWLPNRSGLLWFLSTVWPKVLEKRPDATLKIAGVGDGQYLEAFRTLRGITLLGRVERLEPLYEECMLAIAPLFQGSGTRVKILESGRFARPVLTTALGAEGCGLTPNDSYFRAEDADAWVTSLSTLTVADCARVGKNAHASIRERFDSATIAARLIGFLNGLRPAV